MAYESPIRDLSRKLRDLARDHAAYSQVADFIKHLDEHLSALAYAEEINQRYTGEKNMTDVVGKWLIISEEECYCCGQIESLVSTSHFLLRMRPPKAPSYSRIYSIENLADDNCMIFDTEKELDTWAEWMNDPDDDGKPRIVNIKGGKI